MSARAALGEVAALLALLGACAPSARRDDFEREAGRIEQALATPEGARLSERGVKTRTALQVAQTWTLRAGTEWSKYGADVEAALTPAYSCAREPAVVVCSRWIPGDMFQLRIEGQREGEGFRIHAELQGRPD